MNGGCASDGETRVRRERDVEIGEIAVDRVGEHSESNKQYYTHLNDMYIEFNDLSNAKIDFLSRMCNLQSGVSKSNPPPKLRLCNHLCRSQTAPDTSTLQLFVSN